MKILFQPCRGLFFVGGENLSFIPSQGTQRLGNLHLMDRYERRNPTNRKDGWGGRILDKGSLQAEVLGEKITRGIVLVAEEGIGASPEQAASLGP